jgi:transposase InsO family protein
VTGRVIFLYRQAQRRRTGVAAHAVDTATRWAVVEILIGPANSSSAARFCDRVIRKLHRLGVGVSGVLTDNGPEFRGAAFTAHLTELGVTHHRTPPRSPNHNAVLRALPRHRAPRVLATRVPA